MEPQPAPPPPADIRRVLLVWVGRLGDLLVATPFLAAARRRYPAARVTLVVGEGASGFGALCPDADEVLVLRRWTRAASNIPLAARLAARRWDLLVDLNSAPSRSSAVLCRLARARFKLAFDTGRRGFTHLVAAPAETEHMLDRYARLAAALGAPYDPRLRVRVPPADLEAARRIALSLPPAPGPLVGVHPGNFKKFDNRWPEDKFVELIDRLHARGGLRLVLLAGPGEQEPVRRLASRLRRPPAAVLGPLPLGLTAALLSWLDLLVVNATGTAHLAAAVGTPTFTFLSRYTKTVWMSRSGPHAGLVSSSWESCRDIPVDDACRALDDVLKSMRPRPASGR